MCMIMNKVSARSARDKFQENEFQAKDEDKLYSSNY